VILFKEECFGQDFFNAAEFRAISDLFSRAQRGVCFSGKFAAEISEKMSRAYAQHGVRRFVSFIGILNDLAEQEDYRLLASADYKPPVLPPDMNRLSKVLDFLTRNFQKPLSLQEIAAEAYMSPTAFCRYFKEHTNKTVIRFLNELRVGHAKKLLTQDRSNVSEIHYDCGFPNASNFYEQFSKIAGCSPLKFRKQQEGRLINRSRI
jgi:AraC-like DNA-binding protein